MPVQNLPPPLPASPPAAGAHTPTSPQSAAGSVWSDRTDAAAAQLPPPPKRLLLLWTYEDIARFYVTNLRIQIVQLLVIVVACMTYVIEGYVDPHSTNGVFVGLESFFLFSFLLDLLFNYGAAPNKWQYVWSVSGAVDIIAVLPVLFLILQPLQSPQVALLSSYVRNLRSLKILRLTRFHRVLLARYWQRSSAEHGSSLQTYSGTVEDKEAVRIRFIKFLLALVTFTYIATGLIHDVGLSRPGSFTEDMAWHDALYFVVVTMATIGYGDIAPTIALTRLLVILLVCSSLILIPYFAGKLIEAAVAKDRKYKERARLPRGAKHLVVTGSFSYQSLSDFLAEVFHDDHGEAARLFFVLILHPDEPPNRIKTLLAQAANHNRVQYLRGSPMEVQDLQRCMLHSATAVFLLTTRERYDAALSEDRIVLYAVSIIKYLNRTSLATAHHRPASQGSSKQPVVSGPGGGPIRVRTIAKVQGSMAEGQLTSLGFDSVISMTDIKLRVMAYGSLFPGFIALLGNLLRSNRCHHQQHHPHDGLALHWQDDYLQGSDFSIHCLTVRVRPRSPLVGKNFSQVAMALYASGQVLLLAVKLHGQLVVNPARELVFHEGEYIVYALALAHAEALEALHSLTAADFGPLVAPLLCEGEEDQAALFRRAAAFANRQQAPPPPPLLMGQSPSASKVPRLLEGLQDSLKRVEQAGGGLVLPAVYEARAAFKAFADVKTELPEEAFVDHLVVCNCDPDSPDLLWMAPFFVTIRRGTSAPIVVLSACQASFKALVKRLTELSRQCGATGSSSRVRLAERLYLVQGSPLRTEDLRKCRVSSARVVVLMGREHHEQLRERDAPLADRSTLLAAVTLESVLKGRLYEKVFTITDLLCDSNISNLRQMVLPHANPLSAFASSTMPDAAPTDGVMGPLRSPVMALTRAAHAKLSLPMLPGGTRPLSMAMAPDPISSSAGATTHPHPLMPEEQASPRPLSLPTGPGLAAYGAAAAAASAAARSSSWGLAGNKDLSEWPVYAAGRVLSGSMLDTLPVQMFYNPSSLDLIDRLIGSSVDDQDETVTIGTPPLNFHPGFIDQLKVPSVLARRPYRLLMDLYLAHDLIPLGLYRPRGCKGAPMAYVHLNPFPEETLQAEDLVYVLRPCRKVMPVKAQPGTAADTAGGYPQHQRSKTQG